MKKTSNRLPTKAVFVAGLYLSAIAAHAQVFNSDWSPTVPASGSAAGTFDYDNRDNWDPSTHVPGGPPGFVSTDTATFGHTTVENGTHISVTGFNIVPGAWNFTSPGYVVSTSTSSILQFGFGGPLPGTGITGTPANFPTIINFNIDFINGTAGNATINIDNRSDLIFFNNSTAGHAKINTNGSVTVAVNSGNTASAGDAAINSTNFVSIENNGTAANAVINNDSGPGREHEVDFTGNSTGANAVINNNGGVNSAGHPALVAFFGNATGGNAAINNNDPTAIVDFSRSTGPGGIHQLSVGSLNGPGFFFLGANQLTIGAAMPMLGYLVVTWALRVISGTEVMEQATP
jgi:hypothetical protein